MVLFSARVECSLSFPVWGRGDTRAPSTVRTWVGPYVRSAAKFQFVRRLDAAERAVCARGVDVAVSFRFEVIATHAGSCEVVWFFVFGL